MKEIICKNGERAIVDDDMYEVLSQYVWRVAAYGYAYTLATGSWADYSAIPAMMHHCVAGRSVYNLVTDHDNRDKLDNRRENLHHVTYSQNVRNNGKPHKTPALEPKPPVWAERSHTYQPRMTWDNIPGPTLDDMRRGAQALEDAMS